MKAAVPSTLWFGAGAPVTKTITAVLVMTLAALGRAAASEQEQERGSPLQPLLCIGIFTSEEFPQKCRCDTHCHTCHYTDAQPGMCLRCRDSMFLLDGKCVDRDGCLGAAKVPTGTGNFDRVCRDTVTESQPVAASTRSAHSDQPGPGAGPEHDRAAPGVPGELVCNGLAVLVSKHCVCRASGGAALVACVGPETGCSSAWARGSFNQTAPRLPEYRTGYDPLKCPTCKCNVAGKEGKVLARVQVLFKMSLMQRLRKLAPSCAYVHRYMSMLRDPTRRDLMALAGTAEADPARNSGPDWIVAGSQKAGTSHFFASVTATTPFAAPRTTFADGTTGPVKEVHFFDHCLGADSPRSPQAASLAAAPPESTVWCNVSDYTAMFDRGRTHAITQYTLAPGSASIGEASPGYFLFPELPSLVSTIFPNTRIIVMVREPAARAFSGFLQTHTAWRGISFEQAIGRERAIIEACELLYPEEDTQMRYVSCIWPWFVAEAMESSLQADFTGNRGPEYEAQPSRRCTAGMLRKQSILIRGLYVYHLEPWLARFDKSRVLVLQSERYYESPTSAIKSIRSFLGVSSDFDETAARAAGDAERNSRAWNDHLDADTNAKLVELYRPYSAMLNRLLAKHGLGNVTW